MSKKKGSILLVEDTRHVLKHITKMIEDGGFHVTPVLDGLDAIRLLDDPNKSFQAIAADIVLPNFDGLQLAEYNYKNGKLPFLAFTGRGDAETALEMLKFGVRDFVLKPFKKEKFLAMLKNAIARHLFLSHELGEGSAHLEGNSASITIKGKSNEINEATIWLEKRLESAFGKEQTVFLVGYIWEFLQNAYEHGSLKIFEELKCSLLDNGTFEQEVAKRDAECSSNITIEISILEKQAFY